MPVTSERVQAIFMECIASQEEINNKTAIIVDVLVGKVGLVKDRLEPHRVEIGEMLHDLPKEFQKDSGGGMSFLMACNDSRGEQWTGMHSRMAELFALGMATGQATCLLPREVWAALPGGVPYYMVE